MCVCVCNSYSLLFLYKMIESLNLKNTDQV